MKTLSILIPSLDLRALYLNKMLSSLEDQIVSDLDGKIEVITFVDNFENTIGYKRNKLLEAATGKFTCFVDDDDVLHPEYCSTIVGAIEAYPEVQHIGFKVRVFINGGERRPAYHSLQYIGWYQNRNGYFRQTTTLNPMLSSISKSVKFKEINMREDEQWVKDIIATGKLQKEYFIDDFMYLYYFHESTSLSGDRRMRNQQNQKINWGMKPITKLKVVELCK